VASELESQLFRFAQLEIGDASQAASTLIDPDESHEQARSPIEMGRHGDLYIRPDSEVFIDGGPLRFGARKAIGGVASAACPLFG
jgi:hypothetical protein